MGLEMKSVKPLSLFNTTVNIETCFLTLLNESLILNETLPLRVRNKPSYSTSEPERFRSYALVLMVMPRKDNNLKGEKKAIIRNPMSGTKTQERTSFVLGHFVV